MLTCLIVTPDKPVRDALRVGIEQLQCFRIRSADADTARDLVEAHAYDLIVCDAYLEDNADGIELLHELRAAQPEAQLALITHGKAARVTPKDREALGLAAVFRAPFATAEFFGVLARLMERLPTHAAR